LFVDEVSFFAWGVATNKGGGEGSGEASDKKASEKSKSFMDYFPDSSMCAGRFLLAMLPVL
jgi:hypothetical protein